MVMTTVPLLKLSSDNIIPQIGLGTWLIKSVEIDQVVKTALECGYRHIDCAFIYGNQPAIGIALKEVFGIGKIKREDLFITSKVWNTFHPYELTLKNVDMILEELGLDYLDLCLVHWPMAYKEGGEVFPKEGDKILLSDIDYLETWRAMEKCVRDGKIRSIGLSNFNSEQIERVIKNSEIKPSALEVEFHPYFQRKKLVDFCKQRGIQVIAYSPLANSGNANPFKKEGHPNIFTDPAITRIAQKHGKSNAQVVLKFLTQQYGVCVIPKSVNEGRIRENLEIFNFDLTQEELDQMMAIDQNRRIVHLPLSCHSPNYPFGPGKPEF